MEMKETVVHNPLLALLELGAEEKEARGLRYTPREIYQQPETARVALQSPPVLSAPTSTEGEWSLTSPVATQIFRTQPVRRFNESAQTHRAGAPPRYVLDSVPVSYEPTFRF